MTGLNKPAPPNFVVRTISALLPPDRREQILGDLEERFRETRWGLRTLRYIRDANSILPRVLWREVKRFDIGPIVPARLPVELGEEAVRAEVEAFQHQNYCRYLFYFGMMNLLSLLLLIPFVLKMHDPTAVLGLCAFLISLRFTADQHRRRGGGRVVPVVASLAELVEFHRQALIRRRRFCAVCGTGSFCRCWRRILWCGWCRVAWARPWDWWLFRLPLCWQLPCRRLGECNRGSINCLGRWAEAGAGRGLLSGRPIPLSTVAVRC